MPRYMFRPFALPCLLLIRTSTQTGRSRGYCFVYFEHVEDAKAAMEQCTGMELNSRTIRVDYSMTKRAHTPTPGIYKGRTLRHRTEPADTLLAAHQQRRTYPRSSSVSRSRSRSQERRSSRRDQSHSRSSRRLHRYHEVAGDDDDYYYRRGGRSSSRDRRSNSSYVNRTRTRSNRRHHDRRATHSRSRSRTSREDRKLDEPFVCCKSKIAFDISQVGIDEQKPGTCECHYNKDGRTK